jgi:phosphatidylserine decarboxylase
MTLQERVLFVRQLRHSFTSIGALLPTSGFAARAMTSEVARRVGPRTILEVGAGTGAITAAIVEQMRPDDRLVLVEIEEEFVHYLQQRFEREPSFRRVRDQVTILQADVTQLDRNQQFDYIVSAIPFTNCPPETIEAILSTYREILKPDGVLTYIEYAFLRKLKQWRLSGEQRLQFERSKAVLDRYQQSFEFRRDLVWRNVPPAWIHHLRLQEPAPQDALTLEPLRETRRIALGGGMAVSTEAVPWVGGLLAAAWILTRRLRALALLLAATVTAFFRDPHRNVITDPNVVYAAADGQVLSVERLHDERFGDGEWVRIAVFLSLLDVHINRSPIAGKVIRIVSEQGGFAAAYSAASEHNYAQYTLIEGARGRCVVTQRVGLIARRIVNWSKQGMLLAQGDRFGLIRFGSRTDVYLPADQVTASVQRGDRVVGGETIIARYI